MFYYTNRQLDNYAPYAFFMDAFSVEECEKIKTLFVDQKEGTVGPGSVDKVIRDSKIQFIKYDESNDWIFRKISELATSCNLARWNFQLSGMIEGIQLTEYEKGGHYGWHTDSGPGAFSIRKLSVVIQLSNAEEYEGGELEFIEASKDEPIKKQGAVFIFPSYAAHRIKEVTSGNRKSAVAWISGDPYR